MPISGKLFFFDMKLYRLLITIPLLLPLLSLAQNGFIRGTVIDGDLGEPLFGANILIENGSGGAVTDFDGKFEISIAPGTYVLNASFIGLADIKITDVKVLSEEVTLIDNVIMKAESNQLNTFTVSANVIRNTEAAIINIKKKSASVMDGISAAKFRRIGDSDAASAIKRVTGVSVEAGKYVYVRGLGDRYTKTMLNGLDIPGLDPDRNSIQIDIFPTSLIGNMTVLKSASAEFPADFTGGIVNIETVDFPDKKIFDVSIGVGFNPEMHFNSDYLSYPGGRTDFLGFDDGTREIPTTDPLQAPVRELSSYFSKEEIKNFSDKFSKNLAVEKNPSFMDYNFSTTIGNQKKLNEKYRLGYFASINYRKEQRHYDDFEVGEYQKNVDQTKTELAYVTVQRGAKSTDNVLLGAIGGIALKTANSSIKLSVLHLQNGENTASLFSVDNNGGSEVAGQSGYVGIAHNLQYNQRSISNLLLHGKHILKDKAWEINWKVSPTLSSLEDPDIRKAGLTTGLPGTDSIVNAGETGFPKRIWRDLDESSLNTKIDFTRNYKYRGKSARFKFGSSISVKNRDYSIIEYNLNAPLSPVVNGGVNSMVADSNFWPNGSSFFYTNSILPVQVGSSLIARQNPNEYNSRSANIGTYVSNEFKPFFKTKVILGLRVESFQQWHTGRNQTYATTSHLPENQRSGLSLDDDLVLNAIDLFPSANIIYALSDDQNLRLSYAKTIARPSFKELSYAQIYDPLTDRMFNGALSPSQDWDGNLVETRIDNIDIRWEWFAKKAQLLSISAFFKNFDDPIELTQIQLNATSQEFQPKNVGQGRVIGAEFEFRKNFEFLNPKLEKLTWSGNLTLVQSQINMTEYEFQLRKRNLRGGETVKNTRTMAGQAPYLINSGLTYVVDNKNLDLGLFYNVQGPSIIVVGGSIYSDVYSEPFHSLRFNISKKLDKEGKKRVKIGVSNILNDDREQFYKAYESTDKVYTKFSPGVAFSASFSYKL